MRLLKQIFGYLLTAIIFLGGVFLYYYYYLDGNLINQIITYRPHIDQMALDVEHEQYCPGDIPRAKTSFCKNRQAVGLTSYTLINGSLTIYPQKPARELPIGCYPEDPEEDLLFAIQMIPLDADPGMYHFKGVSTQTISGNRTRQLVFSTEEFKVVECNV